MEEYVKVPLPRYSELLKYEEIVQSLECMVHEPRFKEEFVERAKAAEKRVGEGDSLKFNSVKELEKHLEE